MRDIPRKYWSKSFESWILYATFATEEVDRLSMIACGYCEYRDTIDGKCAPCALVPRIGICSKGAGLWKQWHLAMAQNSPNWGRVRRLARRILQAIIADGRRLGYVGDKEEVKVKAVLG